MGTENDSDLIESMAAFEAAFAGEETELPELEIRVVLVALDRSNQDEATRSLAREVSTRTGARLLVTHAYPGPPDEAREDYIDEQARSLGATVARGEGDHAFEQILSAVTISSADMLIVPGPYLADIEVLGQESLGQTLDLVLARLRVPALVVRRPSESIGSALEDLLIPITFSSQGNLVACALALELARAPCRIVLLSVADKGVLDKVSHLLGDFLDPRALDGETLEALQAKEHAGLIAALQKECASREIDCRVKVRVGDPLEVLDEVAGKRLRLVMIGVPDDRHSVAFQQVLAFLRNSANPVLVV